MVVGHQFSIIPFYKKGCQETANSQEFLGASQLTFHESVFPAGMSLQRQTAVGP